MSQHLVKSIRFCFLKDGYLNALMVAKMTHFASWNEKQAVVSKWSQRV